MTQFNDNSYTPPGAVPDYLIRYATFRQLQIFEAIVRLGSFTRTAEEMFLTQPTVSMQTKKLAESIGMPLFEHVGRNVRPTEAGLELYQACRQIFQILANFEMKVADFKGIRRGRLRLGVITTAKYFAPEILGEFCRLYPGIDVALKVSNRDRLIERIASFEDDLYIMGQPPTDPFEMEAFPLAPNPLVVMAPRDHPLVGQKKVSLARVAEEPIILREPGSGIRDATLQAFADIGVRPSVRMELGSNEAIKHAIVGGLGLSVLSLHTLTLEGPDGPVAVLDVENFPVMRQWYIVYPKGKGISLVARAFLDFALKIEPEMRQRMQESWSSVFPDLGLRTPSIAPATGMR